jgi:2-oxoglutarate ferredoxin oxidoreductase subunit alpha
MHSVFMEGNEAIAWGAKASGCRFFAGYPITPATTIYQTMINILPSDGGIVMQGEDEIASIGFCLGASMAGLKAMTATSGPGISLYSEQISFAIGSEIPLVIVDVQRLGPSTGSATRGADGDIQFLRWGNSGGLPVVVLAPEDVRDCYTLTQKAFNLAERFRCPVFVASNKEIGMTRENLDLDALEPVPSIDRTYAGDRPDYIPFYADSPAGVPPFLPIGGDIPVRQTSSTHGPDGYITTDPVVISRMQERLRDKLESEIDSYSYYDAVVEPDADTWILTYGVSARAARACQRQLKADGKSVSLLVLKTLWPVPEELIRRIVGSASRVVTVEMNLGQYVHEIRRILPDRKVLFVGQMDGRMISPKQIQEAIIHD